MSVDRVNARTLLAVVVVLSTAVLVVGYVDAERRSDAVTGSPEVEQAFRSGDRTPVVEPRDAITVVATDSNAFVTDENDGPRAQAELVAFAPDGRIYYYENRHTRYWDVDPVAGTNATVEFVYADHHSKDECGGETVCTENGIERVNLTTGERKRVYSRVTAGKHSTRWHDADRIDDERLLVADIEKDRVFVVNTTTELIEWEWDAQAAFDVDSGGPYPEDWTHLNDVEYVTIDGRETVMVSMRNHDQVVFVDVERGLRPEWTLGSDDDHGTLHEQHNPDYIPPERGGPALLVADSENGRVVEYQREDGDWVESWSWSDDRTNWPRDADRLPSGHTLVTDSNGDRVLELDEGGDVIWSASIGFPYEAERLGTGDESTSSESARRLDLERASADDGDSLMGRVLPTSVVNAIAYVFPRWIGVPEGVAAVGLLVAVPCWLLAEYRWSTRSISLHWPIRFER
jgi:hypothetical protein